MRTSLFTWLVAASGGPQSSVLLPVLVLVGLWVGPEVAGAQDARNEPSQVEIIAPADSLVQATEEGKRVQKLIGNVHLRQGTTLLSADRATRYLQRGEIIFAGDVLIIDEGDSLWADRVRYDSRRKVGRATGDVRVSDGEVLLAGPTGHYFFNEKHAVFPERVTLVDSARVLKSKAGEYFSRDKRAEFYRQVRVFSDSTYLEADSVTYHRSTEVSEARGHVFIERRGDRAEEEERKGREESPRAVPEEQPDPQETRLPNRRRLDGLRADTTRRDTSIRARRPSLLGRPLPVDTTRRALLPDTTARTLLWGQHAYNDPRSGYSRVRGRALLVRLEPPDSSETDTEASRTASADSAAIRPVEPPPAGRPDTLIVRARQLETTRSDTLRRLTATGSVRLWQKDLQAVSDSAVYDRWPARGASEGQTRRQESRFFGTPIAWSTDAQLSGDSLRVTGRRQAVRRLHARGNAFLAQEDSVLTGRLQQLKGRRLTGYFARDSLGETTLERLTAGPNAEAIHFQKTDEGALGGAVRVSSDSIAFQLRDGELHRMRVLSGVEGRRYEAEDVPTPFRLEGLQWVPERRPRKKPFLTEERVRRVLTRPAAPGRSPAEPPVSEPPVSDAPPPATAEGSSDG